VLGVFGCLCALVLGPSQFVLEWPSFDAILIFGDVEYVFDLQMNQFRCTGL
jgi:hypothetical protein